MADPGGEARPSPPRTSIWWWVALGLAFVAGAGAGAGPSRAADRDLHLEWEERCAECHGHAGAFARDRLAVVDGVLTSDHWGRDLGRFLANHHTSPATLERIIAMLSAQATTPPIYAQKCTGCHGTAADLVRTSIELRGGRLFGATNGRPLDLFLQRHGGLTPAEVPLVLERLARLHDETGGG